MILHCYDAPSGGYYHYVKHTSCISYRHAISVPAKKFCSSRKIITDTYSKSISCGSFRGSKSQVTEAGGIFRFSHFIEARIRYKNDNAIPEHNRIDSNCSLQINIRTTESRLDSKEIRSAKDSYIYGSASRNLRRAKNRDSGQWAD